MNELSNKSPVNYRALFQDEMLETELEYKDKNNFEVSFDYILQKNVKINDYSITGYIFIPPELKLNADTYTRQQFFQDFQSSIRFQTPIFPLNSIINEDNNLSPINRVRKILDEIASGGFDDEEINQRLIYELKMYAQIVRSNLKNQILFLVDMCPRDDSTDIVIETVQTLVDAVNKIQDKFHGFEPEFFSLHLPERTRATYFAADEYVSYYIEHYFTVFFDKINKVEYYSSLVPLIQDVIIKRQERRKKMNYSLVLDVSDTERIERFHYWKGVLKSYIKQVLVLQTKMSASRKTLRVIFGALGAFVAMGVYIFLTVGISTNLYLTPWVIIVLAIYVLRENIKVIFSTGGERFLSKWIPDRKYDIYNILGRKEKIGNIGESAKFIKFGDVPEEIIKIRNKDRASVLEREFEQEEVILYRKTIQIEADKITHIHERHKNISDVMKINIRNFLSNAWDPQESITYYNSAEQRIDEINVPISYHLNMVLRQDYKDVKGNERTKFKRIRVIFNKNGIQKIEEISV
ncbi:MAG TPA: hypothetical protein VKM55_12305 [Candidatus Lokiarchaeia archaeon]|nr:hypothetical protein [Candidatus Lokiarchaeia archaeon]